MNDKMQSQKNEFDSLVNLIKRYNNLPPIVDDDYPECRHYYERAIKDFIKSLRENGRLTENNTISKSITDNQTSSNKRYGIGYDAVFELEKAQDKFPPFNSAHEGYAIIKEELDELWEVVRENQATPGRNERLKKEAIQVAAMALRFIYDLSGFKN